jgi:hypothetical protein
MANSGTHTEVLAQEEVERFFAAQPTPEQIVAFSASPRVSARFYSLVERQRSGTLTDEQQRELDIYQALEHRVRLAKAEAHRLLAELRGASNGADHHAPSLETAD